MSASPDQRDCLVYIIESPSPRDDYEGRCEGETIHKMLNLAGINSAHHRVSSSTLLWYALEELKGIAAQSTDKVFLLHLSAHGSSEGFALTDGSTVSWADLKEPLAAVNNSAKGRLILCMSSCEGFHAIEMAMQRSGIPPFLGVVGHGGKPTWRDTAFGFPIFYHLYARGYGVEAAVDRMRTATDDGGFLATSASTVQQVFIEQIQQAEAAISVPRELVTARVPVQPASGYAALTRAEKVA